MEAKISGSVKLVEDKQVVILAGGSIADYQFALPIFETLGKQSFIFGEVGMASAAKLSLNYFWRSQCKGLQKQYYLQNRWMLT
jgi:3-hydroxyisobutyrate dehydrogenase-like beta-hydroxyacid dehydrogenase